MIRQLHHDIYFDASLYYSSAGENGNSYYESMQVLMARMAAGDIDFIIADAATINEFAYNQYFCDLSEVLPEDNFLK